MLWGPGLNVVGIFFGVVLSTLPFSFPVAFPQNPGWEFYLSCFCHVALALLLQLNYQKLTRDRSWATQILLWKFEIWNLVVDRAESYQ